MRSIKNLAIIPARGGSKRIPRKNIKEFCGKPIIAYSIECALACGLFDEVMVSTDAEEIKDVAEQFGAVVPFMRSGEAANDHAPLAEVLLEVVSSYAIAGVDVESICCILPTAPLLRVDTLQNSFEQFVSTGVKSLIPVVQFSYPIQRALKCNSGLLSFFDETFASTRSQDLEPAFHDVGQFYFIDTDSLLQEKTLFTTKTGSYKLSEKVVQDIDTQEDWELAELKYEFLNHSQ